MSCDYCDKEWTGFCTIHGGYTTTHRRERFIESLGLYLSCPKCIQEIVKEKLEEEKQSHV